jgi:DNA-3-methyladenine glycosylase
MGKLRNEAKAPGPPPGVALGPEFFDRDAQVVACDLLGKVLCHVVDGVALWAAIVEAEAYYLAERASHASLGYTDKRRALFMPPGTIYMYYARGGDSFNVSCAGAGNAVLLKAGWVPAQDGAGPLHGAAAPLAEMRRRTPLPSGRPRPAARLVSGQTLLCKALGLHVPDWDARPIGTAPLALLDVGYRPRNVLRTTRLGIPPGRDGHLPYRFVDAARAAQATAHPLRGAGRLRTKAIDVPAGAEPPDWTALLGLSRADVRGRRAARRPRFAVAKQGSE